MNCLPLELLEIIISFVPPKSLKRLSIVNRLLRDLCSPLIFRSIQVGIAQAQFDKLFKISKSSYAPFVRVIRYEANALLDPIHPSNIQSRMDEKRKILQASDILSEALPRLSNLNTIEIDLVHGIKDQFGHASGYMLPHQDYYHGPLEKLLTATLLAQQNGVTVQAFRISGFYHQAAIDDCFLQALASRVLSEVKEIRITSTSPIFPFISGMPLMQLQRLELIDIWLSLEALEDLVRHAEHLKSLHLENIWLVDELANQGPGMSKGTTISVLELLARLYRPLEITITYCERTQQFVI
ncbi:hypothetical protein BDV18DRAFT_152217 [Aspergillus unguis]